MSQRFLVGNGPLGQMVAELADKLAEAQAAMRRVRAAADAASYGTPQDNLAIEAEFGLPAGKGEEFYFLLASAATALDAAILQEFVRRTDQG